MRDRYLEGSFRKGRLLAAYLYLPRRPGDRGVRTSKAASGLVIDYGESGKPIGIEITAPGRISLATFNRVLTRLAQPLVSADELAPLKAA